MSYYLSHLLNQELFNDSVVHWFMILLGINTCGIPKDQVFMGQFGVKIKKLRGGSILFISWAYDNSPPS